MRVVTDSAADLTLEEALWPEVQVALWVSVMHGKFPEQADALAELLRKRLDIGRIEILRISPVLASSGPP